MFGRPTRSQLFGAFNNQARKFGMNIARGASNLVSQLALPTADFLQGASGLAQTIGGVAEHIPVASTITAPLRDFGSIGRRVANGLEGAGALAYDFGHNKSGDAIRGDIRDIVDGVQNDRTRQHQVGGYRLSSQFERRR